MNKFQKNELKMDILTQLKEGRYDDLYYNLNFKSYIFKNLTDDDFDGIFSQLQESNEFKENFSNALKKKEYHFSIPINTLFMIAERPVKTTVKILKDEIC